MSKGIKRQKWFVLGIIILCLFMICVFAEEKQKEETQKEDEVIATFDGGNVLRGELEEKLSFEGILRGVKVENDKLIKDIKEIAAEKIYHNKGVKEGLLETEEFKELKKNWEQRELGRLLYVKVVSDNVSVTDDDEKKYYEEHPDQFKRDFSFTMRHIFLSTYKEYKVQPGDTLYEIAKNISGDSDLAKNILDKDRKEIDLKKAIRPGDILYVPMNKEDKEKVRKKMEDIKAKLDAGEDFMDMAEKYSESESSKRGEKIGPLPIKNAPKPLLSEIREAAEKTPAGQYTDIIETKHGFQIMKIESKTEPGIKDFLEVKIAIENRLEKTKRRDLEQNYIDKLTNGENVTSNFDVLKEEDIKDDAVIFKIGDFVYTKKDMDEEIESLPPRNKVRIATPEDKIRFAKNKLLMKAVIADAKAQKLDETDEYKDDYAKFEQNTISNTYMKENIYDKIEIKDDELKKYYEDNKDKYKNSKKVDVDIIVKKIRYKSDMTEEEKQKEIDRVIGIMKGLREKIISGEKEFEFIARKESEDPSASKGGKLGLINPAMKGKDFPENVDKMKVGEISEPFITGNKYVNVARLNKVEEETYKDFDEVKNMVEYAVKNLKREEVRVSFDDKVLKENNFKIIVDLDSLKTPEETKD